MTTPTEKVFCAECQKAGLKSRVTPDGGSMTAMYCAPYYAEDGVYHHHDMNVVTLAFACSNGHHWTTTSHPKCPSCDWPKGDT
jgi:hypothetical protein